MADFDQRRIPGAPQNPHDTRASAADMRRMTGSSQGADDGSPYARHTHRVKLGDHRQGLNTGAKNKSEPRRRQGRT